jgi:metallothionein
MTATYDTGTVLTCAHEGCNCRVLVQVPCECEGADNANYTCACGAPLVPVTD